MAERFYGVLGVEPDADGEVIRQAYRERLKESHPDVSDDPGAPREFARLTVAREVLVDDEERGRYDRLGHAAYVRDHVDASARTGVNDGTGADTDGAPDSEASAPTGHSPTAGSYATATSTAERTAREGGGRSAGQRDSRGGARDDSIGPVGNRAVDHDSHRGRPEGLNRPQAPGPTPARDDSGLPPGRLRGHRRRERDPLWRRVAAVGRRVGPWALVHLVLVGSAATVAWFGYAGAARLDLGGPGLVVAVVVLVVTLVASAVHLLSRVYA